MYVLFIQNNIFFSMDQRSSMSEQLLKERNQMLAGQMVASEFERRMAEDVKNGGKRRRESMDVRMKEEIEGGRKKGGGEGEVAEVAVVEQRKTSSDVKIPPRNRRKSIKKDFGQLVVGKSSSSSSSPSPKKVTSALAPAPPAPPAPPAAPPASAASAATTTAPAPGLPVLVREIMNFNNCDEEAAKEMIIDDVIGKKF